MAAGAAALAGVVARVLCARVDLWLDEIGAFIHTAGMRSVLDAVLTVHSDNNHPINTAWAWVLGPQRCSTACPR
ncbi:MAG: hypothetical protein EXR95_09345 [Gemmatimonadetes bacterium]|nr:hypothetical protein [Gemmatimonadota bacterium]